jgi:rubrerythrin
MSISIAYLLKALEEEPQARHNRYMEFAGQAEEGGLLQAAKLFRAIVFAEKARVNLYCKSLSSMGSRDDLYDYYICPNCGYASGREAPDACPVCETASESFEKVD